MYLKSGSGIHLLHHVLSCHTVSSKRCGDVAGKLSYVQCNNVAGIWCWRFTGQWMLKIYRYINC